MTSSGSKRPGDVPKLTEAQQVVLELMASGHSSQEIARKLHRSIRTIESHRYHLGKKLGAKNQIDLIHRARRYGLLPNDFVPSDSQPEHGFADSECVHITSLRAVAACVNAKPGRDGILTSVSHLATVMQANAVFFAEIQSDDRLRVTACHSSRGSLLRLECPYTTELRSTVNPGRITRMPFNALPSSFTAEIEGNIGPAGWCTVASIRDCDRELGLLCILHDQDFDQRLMPDLLLRCIGDRIRCDLGFIETARRRRSLQSLLNQAEQFGRAGILQLDFSKDEFVPSRTAAKMLDINADPGSLAMDHLFASAHDEDKQVLQSTLASATNSHDEISISFRTASSAGKSSRVTMLIPESRRAERQSSPVTALLFADPNVSYQPTAISLVQRMVSRCPNPTVTIDRTGAILAASPAWRCLMKNFSEKASPTDYFQQIRAMTDDEDYQQIRTTLNRALAAISPEPCSVTILLRSLGLRLRIDIIPIPESGLINITHNRDDDIDESVAWWSANKITTRRAAPKATATHAPASSNAWPETQSELLEWAIEHSNDLLCICDTDSWIHRANPTMCRVLEYDVSDLVGKSFMDLFYETDHDTINQLVAGLCAGQSVDRVVLPMRAGSGETKYIEWSASPPPPASILFLPTGRDVTEQANATRGLYRIRDQFSRYLGPKTI
ncbi:MAG: PAS domain-containing protein [Phycisphaerales bacterium]|nr:PAS domain-containing protein [Planctomycetota bacterium]MCH8507631.1 PAS domain-containing protein [Phycisphaerales bacterium]